LPHTDAIWLAPLMSSERRYIEVVASEACRRLSRTVVRSAPEKLRRASPHWMQHTHAALALERGVDLTTVRDNLRHASLSTTSIYLHTDEAHRARQLREAFAGARR
jgi:site-specific recombinase XerD